MTRLQLWSLVSLAAATVAQPEVTPLATLRNGTFYGLHNTYYNQDFFLGMPYAQPPLGDLRFNNPQSLNTTWQDSRDATQFSPQCIGYGSDDWVLGNAVSEDCLTINVVRPGGVTAGSNVPVAVWIHGGGFVEGGAADPRYNLSFITRQAALAGTPIITVSLQYRLQAFGMLFGTRVNESGVANIGFKDQRLALRWVQENIAAFGGDAAKVTIWGESAGAGSVGVQMLAYGGRDDKLFRGAIQESGGMVGLSRYLSPAQFDKFYDNITRYTNCDSAADTLQCLRRLPIEVLSPVLNSSVTAQVPLWGPQIDGDFIRDTGTRQLHAGDFVKVPLLHGTNHDEGTQFAARGINTSDQFVAGVVAQGADNMTAQVISALYPDIPAVGIPGTEYGRPPISQAALGHQWKREAAYAGDFVMHAPRRLTSETYARYNLTSWSYLFNVLVSGLPATTGSTHFQEVAFAFDNVHGLGYQTAVATNPFADAPVAFRTLANLMTHYWIAFVNDLDPNTSPVSNIKWPTYNTTLYDRVLPHNIVFDVNVTGTAYLDVDRYRAEGIQYLKDRFVTVFGR